MAKSTLEQLACSLGRKDQKPNIALAEKISKASDNKAVAELVDLMNHKLAAIRHDAIKVLYETGERTPALIIPYSREFLKLFEHKDNWMKWGAMTALSAISNTKPDLVATHLTSILDAMDTGSVITRDHGIYILCNVSKLKKYHEDCMELLLEQIQKAPVNQVPMYAEKTAEVISLPYVKKLERILRARLDVMEVPSKEKRIEKLLKNLLKVT
ncbi:MAG: hypothetical protein IPP15_21745 [Saprospiraceae bacterium]|uniref:Uncharacterized protein n=1 Tax=Candidatus Opimibacter skivensis TaxID=2982028 RepID=A0A9D7SZP5_9BACT|nr:hypothetical protein [Candidatus Opimibacter skivensis]